MKDRYQSLSHTKWQCKYHVIFIPKYRRRRLFGVVRRELGEVFHRLAGQKGCEILEGHIMRDHVHMLLGCGITDSPESVALAYLNNLAYVQDRAPVLREADINTPPRPVPQGVSQKRTSPPPTPSSASVVVPRWVLSSTTATSSPR